MHVAFTAWLTLYHFGQKPHWHDEHHTRGRCALVLTREPAIHIEHACAGRDHHHGVSGPSEIAIHVVLLEHVQGDIDSLRHNGQGQRQRKRMIRLLDRMYLQVRSRRRIPAEPPRCERTKTARALRLDSASSNEPRATSADVTWIAKNKRRCVGLRRQAQKQQRPTAPQSHRPTSRTFPELALHGMQRRTPG